MPDYKVTITLSNDETAEYGVTNGAVNPRNVPREYSTQQWVVVNRVLTDWLDVLTRGGIKKLEIERE